MGTKYTLSKTALLEKLLRAASAARISNRIDAAVMASPPTISSGASSTLAVNYATVSGGVLANQDKMLVEGGVPFVHGGSNMAVKSVSIASGGNVGSTAMQNQVSVSVMTDSPNIEFQFYPQNTTSVRFYVSENGGLLQPCTSGLTALNSSTATSYTKLAFGASKQRLVVVEYSKLYSDTAAPAALLNGIRVDNAYAIWQPKEINPVNAAFCGDSYTVGSPSDGYSHDVFSVVMARKLGWRHTALALGGTGYTRANGVSPAMKDRLADLTAQTFDAFVFFIGTNDDAYYATTLQADALACFREARAANALAPIFVFGTAPRPNLAAGTTVLMDAAIKGAFDTFADSWSFWIPVGGDPAGSWMPGTSYVGNIVSAADVSGRYIGSDGTHPVKAGAYYYGTRAADAVVAKLLAA